MHPLKLVCIVCAVTVLIVVIILLLIALASKIEWDRIAGIAQKHCDEYNKQACKLQPPNNESSPSMGGKYVSVGELPHMAYLQESLGRALRKCSGTLISEYFVMTAAHCVHDANKTNLRVILGAAFVLHVPDQSVFKIDEIHVHDSFDNEDMEKTFFYDIALLKLSEPVKFDWKMRPICLNTDYESVSTVNKTGSGWGIDETRNESFHLRKVDLYTDEMINRRCTEFLGRIFSWLAVVICAGHPTEHQSLCQVKISVPKGDSGGPLQIPLKNGCANTYEQLGIASFLIGNCTSQEYPLNVFTKVELLLPWIVNIVWPD